MKLLGDDPWQTVGLVFWTGLGALIGLAGTVVVTIIDPVGSYRAVRDLWRNT